jgi:hypothetical protein
MYYSRGDLKAIARGWATQMEKEQCNYSGGKRSKQKQRCDLPPEPTAKDNLDSAQVKDTVQAKRPKHKLRVTDTVRQVP